MRRCVAVAVAFVLLFAPRTSYAQDAAASAADALFQSGKAAMDRGELDIACEQLRESFRLQAAVGTLLNVGACEERRGHYALALQCFRDALAMLGAGDYRTSYAEARLADLKGRVAFARVVVEGPPRAAVRIVQDGVELGPASLGLELSLDPGDHVWTAAAPGFAVERVEARLARGERRDVVLRLRPFPASSPPSSMRKASGGPAARSESLGPFIVMGSGVAAMTLGTIFGVVVMSAAADVKEHCDPTGCDATGLAAASSGRPFALMSPVLLGAGAALAGGGVLWWRLSRRGPAVALAFPSGVTGTF